LGPLQVSGENGKNVNAKFWRPNDEYYGIYGSGLKLLGEDGYLS